MPVKSKFFTFLSFWFFLVFFQIGAGLHFSLGAPLGGQLFPLWSVGIFISALSLLQLLLDVPVGYLLDRYGYKRLLILGTILFLGAAGWLMFGLTPTTYILSFVFAAFGWLIYGPGVNAYVLSQAPKEHAGRFISYRDTFGSFGSMCAAGLLWLVLLLSPRSIGLVLMLTLCVALIALLISPKDQVSVHVEQKIPTQHYFIRRHYLPTLIKTIRKLSPASTLLVMLGLSGCLFYGVIWFVIPLIIAQDQQKMMLGFSLGIFDFAIVTLGYLLGNLADKFNKRTMVFLGLLLFAIASLSIGFHFGWLFLLFGFLATTGDEMAGVSLWSWLHALDKNHTHDGTVAGVLTLFQDMGWTIGPIVAGIGMTLIGPAWTIALGAVPILLTWLVAHFIAPNDLCANLPPGTVPRKPLRCPHKT